MISTHKQTKYCKAPLTKKQVKSEQNLRELEAKAERFVQLPMKQPITCLQDERDR
jgi:hypothetical protein